MSVEVTTSATNLPSAHRSLQTAPNGDQWSQVFVSGNTQFRTSTDDGATWTHASSMNITGLALFVVCEDTGRAWALTYAGALLTAGDPTSASSWSTVTTGLTVGDSLISLSVTRTPAGTPSWWLVYAYTASDGTTVARWVRVTNTLAFNENGAVGFTGSSTLPILACEVADNGDVFLLQQGTGTPGVRFRRRVATWVFPRFEYQATAGSADTLSTSSHVAQADSSSIAVDADYAVAGYKSSTSAWRLRDYNRDNETTASRDPATSALTGQVSLDENSNIMLFAGGASTALNLWNRTTGTWGGWVQNDSTTSVRATCAMNGPANRVLGYWRRSNNSIRFDDIAYNNPPTTPTWVGPADGSHQDADQPLPLVPKFNDPEFPVDTLDAFQLERIIDGGTPAYLSLLTGTWGGSPIWNEYASGPNGEFPIELPSGWGVLNEEHDYSVKTRDTLGGAESPWSDPLRISVTAAVHPTMVSPADSSTVTTARTTGEWEVTSQSTWRYQLYNAAGTTVLWTSAWQTSADTRTVDIDYDLVDGVTYQAGIQTRNAAGVLSLEDRVTFTVDYQEPALPTVTVTPDGSHLVVATVHPSPTGGQPDVVAWEAWFRVDPDHPLSAGARNWELDPTIPLGGNGVRRARDLDPESTFRYRAPAARVPYQVAVVVRGDNGGAARTEWV